MVQHRYRRRGVVLASAVALMLAGCDDGGEVVVEDGRATASVGEEVVVPLSVNPGMGDAYEVRAPVDDDVLEFLGSAHPGEAPEGEGAWLDQEFRFRAVGPGATEIVLYNCYRGCIDGVASEPEMGHEVRAEVTVTG